MRLDSTAIPVVWKQSSRWTGGGHPSRQSSGLLAVGIHGVEGGGPRLNWSGSSRATGVSRSPQWGQRGSGVTGIFGAGSPISPQTRHAPGGGPCGPRRSSSRSGALARIPWGGRG